jgi:RimJ/RimL family protein N-acetyltransferase
MTTTADTRSRRATPVRGTSGTPVRGTSGTPGSAVVLRPLEPADTEAVLAVFTGLGARSRELRFLTRKARLSSAEVRRLTAVDRRDHVAYLASTAGDHRPIGIARFVRAAQGSESAEVAVAVVDGWQRRGVGTMLLGALTRHAVEVGVRRFTMFVSNDNRAVHRLLHRSPGGPARLDGGHGVAEYAVSLERRTA